MRVRVLTLLLVLGYGNVSASNHGDNDSARVTNYTPVATSTSGKKWFTFSPALKSSAYQTEESGTKQYKRWTGLKYSGYIRSYNQFRTMPQHNPLAPQADQLLTVNGLDIVNRVYTGYQEPMFLLRLEGTPTAKTWFQIEYSFDNQMMGIIREDSIANQVPGIGQTTNRRAMVYRIMQFKGYANTKVGDFTLVAGGGVNWAKLSPFTLANYQYRDDMFERYPWQPEGNSFGSYTRFYNEQNIARDQRWGNTGTQGFMLSGKNLPKGFGFTFIVGKSDNSGGFQTYLTKTPKNLIAIRVDKSIGVHKIGLNFFDQFGTYDNVGFRLDPRYDATVDPHYLGSKVRQQIITADGKFNFSKFKIYTEVGIGRFQDGLFTDRDYELLFNKKQEKDSITGLNYNWNNPLKAHCFNFQFDVLKSWFGVPLSAQVFSVRKSVANVNSESLNTANNHTVPTPTNINTNNDITVFPGAILDVGQMANNRWGTNIKHESAYGKLKVSAAWAFNKEWEDVSGLFSNRGNSISYWHQTNSFTTSRFTYFQKYAGPYQRNTSIYRRVYESYGITDTVVDYLKMYQTLNLNLAYKLKFFGRDLILNNFNTYNSVTDDNFNPIPVFTDKAFLRTFYEELMAFYNIHPKVTLVSFGSFEKVTGNNRVEKAYTTSGTTAQGIEYSPGDVIKDIYNNPILSTTSDQGATVQQVSWGYGLGIDYDFSSRAGLYVRNRWFGQNDKNFTLNKYKGMETTVELKIFF
ncbi:hypothetical protein SAMN04487930_109115 [Cytophaga hutchinsonii ATCC 33406]|nr:hypothetical protein SAMN04487930_109115 [Cytophaga hutchinsonii ATCC 33406]